MSSIISDIFYNSKNNALIDHYLNQNMDRSGLSGKLLNSQSKQQEFPKKEAYEIEPKFGSSMSDDSQTYHHRPAALAMMFRLIIDFSKSEQFLQKHTSYVIKLQIGIASLQQSLRQSKNTLTADLPISIPLEQLTKNAAISITLTAHHNRNHTVSLVGCCYLPTENIRHMLDKNVNSKLFTLWLKELKSGINTKNSLSGGKFKVQCQVSLENRSGRKDQSSDSLIREWKHTPKEQYKVIEEDTPTSNKDVQKWKHENRGRKPNLPTSKQQSQSNIDMEQKQAPSFYSSYLSKPGQVSANETENLVLKFQLDNKPTRFIIKQYSPNQIIGSVNSETYYFVIKDGKQIKCGEEVCIRSSNLDRAGVTVVVMKGEGISAGFFHLNIMLLMGGTVQGVFPVCSEESGQCVGVVKIGSADEKTGPMPEREKNQKQIVSKEQEIDSLSTKVNGCVLSLVKLLAMAKQQIHENISAQCTTLIIIRYSDTIHKIQKDCQLRIDDKLPLFLEVQINKPIILYSNSGCPQEAEVQIYLDGQLMGYGRIRLPTGVCETRPLNSVVYGSSKQNLTTDSWICNAIFNFTHFSFSHDFFPHSHMETSLGLIANSSMFQQFTNVKHSRNFHQEVMDRILKQHPKIIHIQAHRITHLICEALIRHECSFIYINPKQGYSQTVYQEDSKRLLEQLRFLDEPGAGYVKIADISNILHYYDITSQVCEASRKGSFIGEECLKTDQVLYLFLIARLKICHVKIAPPDFEPQITEPVRQEQTQLVETVTKPSLAPQKRPEHNLEKQQRVTHIEAIDCSNMHTLMHNNTIPSVRIKLEKLEYSSRAYYSCANPVIKLNKKVQHGETIVFYHYNVKLGHQIQISRVMFEQSKREYKLGGKAVAKLLTIQ